LLVESQISWTKLHVSSLTQPRFGQESAFFQSPGRSPGRSAAHPENSRADRQEDHFLRGILVGEKAIFACPLPGKAWIELGRWNPVSLLLLVPAWRGSPGRTRKPEIMCDV
jgi:hypothetical protein